MVAETDVNRWWTELRHGGMVLSPAVLHEMLPEGPGRIREEDYRWLRDAYTTFESKEGDTSALMKWVDLVLERFLGHEARSWQKGNLIEERYTWSTPLGQRVRPNRLLFHGSPDNSRLLVKTDTSTKRVGMGKGRLEYSRFVGLLRATGCPLGIITNGHQFRLVHAGMDYDCWAEWECSRWFEEEGGLELLAGFRSLCGKEGIEPSEGDDFPLFTHVNASRSRQGELSSVLGEQARRAVETLHSSINNTANAHPDLLDDLKHDPNTGGELNDDAAFIALFQASIRIMMRLIIVLFAESRDLLPRNMDAYRDSYGAEGLYATLEQAAREEGEESLDNSFLAWPRLMALFRLIHEGSAFSDIPVPRYGGTLFHRGVRRSPSTVLRALAAFEDPRFQMSDRTVLHVLRLLKIGKVRARRGRSSTWVSGPVDFSTLRTEYIGMMYEGLLDYHPRLVKESDEAMVFLNLGAQPVLPLSYLNKLENKDLKDLINKLKKEKDTAPSDEEGEEEVPSEEELEEEEEQDVDEDGPVLDEGDRAYFSAMDWAKRAVEVGGIVRKPRGGAKDEALYERERDKAANRLLMRVLVPGEMYLIRQSGTRKGTGTFYTKPQLAVPTARRTLEPLVYKRNEDSDTLVPRKPEEILALKVLDPAMGSGSFLVGALRYLTDALFDSLEHHRHIREHVEGRTVVTIPYGRTSKGALPEEVLDIHPHHPKFEVRVKSRLKRYVVENCIYGADINGLAVELGKLSLWIETMDRELPFEFLDHKLKTGNSLVGCWFDRFQDYPLLAWKRDGGDVSHSKGVHFKEKGAWTKNIKDAFKNRIKPELANEITRSEHDTTVFTYYERAEHLHDRIRDVLDRLHGLPIFGDGIAEREAIYRKDILENPDLVALKQRFDAWCALWFWPGDKIDLAPGPAGFRALDEDQKVVVEELRREFKFFHWELEFPDVFAREGRGFDAVLGNPPWETFQPESREFFTRYDPVYRTYGKQDAIIQQQRFFRQNKEIERNWLLYQASFKSYSNWFSNCARPFGDPIEDGESESLSRGKDGDMLHEKWRQQRKTRHGYADSDHPYQYLGKGKAHTYKLFLEIAHSLLKAGGRLGMLVPSSIYTDRGAIELRDLFVNNSRWEWLFGFENRKGIFNIHRSFKFCPIIVEKGGQTEAIKTAFMRRNLEEWENQTPNIIPYPREQVERFSPQSKALLEICTRRDLEVLEKIYDDSVRLGDQAPNCWDVKYTQGEFNMTSDSYLFPPLEWWQELGYCPDRYGRWLPPQEGTPKLIYKGKKIGPDGDIALPLYEGRMISQFDFSSKEWKTGKGRGAIWETIPYTQKEFKPQYLLSSSTCAGWSTPVFGIKIPIMNISSATNTRTVICAITKDYPCNHALNPVRELGSNLLDHLILTGVFNSFVYDTLVRNKMGGLNLSFFILDETAVPKKKIFHEDIYAISAQLSFIHEFFSPEWIRLRSLIPALTIKNWKSLWAVTPHERLRLRCILDAVAAELYGLDYDDFAWILKECAYPVDTIRKNSSTFNPKGFWRVDKEKPPELRHTVLALRAFKDLKAMGLDAFLALNDGEGWMLPEDITYSVKDDDTIAFDEAGGTTAPVRSRLGERFLPWQLEGTPEESWAECERHARNILGEEGFRKLTEELEDNHDPISDDDVATGPRPAGNPSGNMSLKDFMGGR